MGIDKLLYIPMDMKSLKVQTPFEQEIISANQSAGSNVTVGFFNLIRICQNSKTHGFVTASCEYTNHKLSI